MSADSQVRRIIELSGTSGKFELDAKGYTRFVPSDEELQLINRWLATEIANARRAHRERWDEYAENVETYRARKMMVPEMGGKAILPSPIARIPSDKIIATTINNVMRPRPIISFDPYFPGEYPALVPYSDPASGIYDEVPVAINIDAEDLSRHLELGMEFKNRERNGFEEMIHSVWHACVTGGYAWGKVCRKKEYHEIIKPKKEYGIVDVMDAEEAYIDGEEVQWYFVDDRNMLRPNFDQDVDDLDWIAERCPMTPDQFRACYANGDAFLVKDDEAAEKMAATTTYTKDDSVVRTDRATKNVSDPEPSVCELDVMDVWFYRWLKVKADDGKVTLRRFSLRGDFHVGTGELICAYRNPYDHQKRIHVPAQQMLDGACTVGIVKYNQQYGTYAAQAEAKNSHHANNHLYWYDPTAYETAKFFQGRTEPVPAGCAIPGKEGTDWGVVRGGSEHYSLLPLMQWNAGTAQEASKVSEYETRGVAPSHTSPSTVAQLLDRGGQESILALRLLNRFVIKMVRRYLLTARQYQPMGENIPVRDPKTKALMMVPFRYPIGEALDNFRISLTAADDALSRERDPEQMALLLDLYQRHTTFVAQVAGPMMSPDATEEQAKLYREILAGEQKLFDRLISFTRSDEAQFNLMPQVDAILEEKQKIMRQMEAQMQMGAMSGTAQDPNAAGAGAIPATGAGDMAGLAGAGAQPGMDAGAAVPASEGVPAAV